MDEMLERLVRLKRQQAYIEKRLEDIYQLRDLMNNMLTEDRRTIGYRYTHTEFAAMSKLINELIQERSKLLDEKYAIEEALAVERACAHIIAIGHSGE